MCGIIGVYWRPLHGEACVVGLSEVGLLTEALILLSLQLSLHPSLSLDLLLLDEQHLFLVFLLKLSLLRNGLLLDSDLVLLVLPHLSLVI